MYRKTVLDFSALRDKDKGWDLWGDFIPRNKISKSSYKQNRQISYRPKGKI